MELGAEINLFGQDVEKIRTGKDGRDCGVIEYGVRRTEIATGRATCRVCGKKIAKGEVAYAFPWDITGYGSNTATTIHIHAGACDEHNK